MEKAIDRVLSVLNTALKMDYEAICSLVELRVPCNEELANHPTIQVSADGKQTKVGLVGVLNGVIEPLTGERIAYEFDDTNKILRFVAYQPVESVDDIEPGTTEGTLKALDALLDVTVDPRREQR